MDAALSAAVGAALRTDVIAARHLSGGDVAQAFRVDLADGRTVFAKTKPGAPAGFFTTEATGLDWLRVTDTIGVPDVLAVSDDAPNHLVLSWIEEGPGRADAVTDAEFGRGLAAIHRCRPDTFGRADRRTTGSRGLPNEPCDTWSEFFSTQRLLPLARIARDEHALPDATIAGLESIATRLDDLGGDPEPAAQLHGDLWAGNRLVDRGGRNWLIDPAAHGGHREFDLAMMALFGGFGPAAFEAYDEVFPLAVGWRDRVLLHQLAPLAVHAIKFGGSYRDATARAVRAYA